MPEAETTPESQTAEPMPEAAAAAGTPPEEAAESRSPEEQIAELKDRLLRAMAETENVRRRAERDKADAAKYAIANFARDVLVIADNLHRALESTPKDIRDDDPVKNLITGVEMTEKELLAILERHGIRRIDPLDAKFDHNYHQAMFEVPGTGKPNGTVVQVVQTGYVIHDRLLRPAMVGVAKDNNGPKNAGAGAGTGNGNNGAGDSEVPGEHIDTVA